MVTSIYDAHKLLIANRGEIAVRIIRTAKRLGLKTVAIYTPSDALSPHVLQADEAVPLPIQGESSAHTDASVTVSESTAYLSAPAILAICKAHSVTLVHPGYGFLSENADFAQLVVENGMLWLGPRPDVIRMMGIKHQARKVAISAGVEVVPGSDGLVKTEDEAVEVAKRSGFPIMLKATAGGGGMGMTVCRDEDSLRQDFHVTKDRAQSLFHHDGIFLERYYEKARHVEVQVFGNGLGDVIHMRERECSVQRRHQKVIEESPSPFCVERPGLQERICEVAVSLARSIKYGSAGTVEFLVDENTANFYFLEMNTRIQVEHPVTEEIYPGLDIVELMIKQGIAEGSLEMGLAPTSPEMQQSTYDNLYQKGRSQGRTHSIEGRIYAENPYEGFAPSPGLLQYVSLDELKEDWLRIDSWVDTGMTITPYFDPLLAKVIVTGHSREEVISRFLLALDKLKVSGPPNNKEYLKAIARNEAFQRGLTTTRFLETFSAPRRAFKVLSSGIDITVQDLPGRTVKLGIPRSGPMDDLAFAAGNILVGNSRTTEGLEIVVVPGVGCSLQFFSSAAIAVTGKEVTVTVNGIEFPTWSRIVVPPEGKVDIRAKALAPENSNGFRVYVCIKGGFPDIPAYLGSKSTSMGLGGFQGRSLTKGDQISLGDCSLDERNSYSFSLPRTFIPLYPTHWVVYVLPGPHDDEEYITTEGIAKFYSTHWIVSSSSNRLGIRLEAATSFDKIQWARDSGGEGGSHPSNILDNGYAPGTINLNGDTPVILTNEGPDMGGYLCICTVASAEMWKLGQLAPGCTVQFRRLTWNEACQRSVLHDEWLKTVENLSSSPSFEGGDSFGLLETEAGDTPCTPVLHRSSGSAGKPERQVIFRQAGDSAILVEFGEMHLDIFVRARIHAFQLLVSEKKVPGILSLCPCIRSIICFYDPNIISQGAFLLVLRDSEASIPEDMSTMSFPGRRISFPIVLDDKWNKEALQRYMSTTRDKAVYLPSNIEYLARNNGLSDVNAALQKLISSDWLVLGVGFYLACPFLIPIDPRCRLVGQKMNPSRTFTPRGAIGIAGPVAAIYPIESPGGYQLYGRTLPAWQTWGRGSDFRPTKPWLLEVFDQAAFTPMSEGEYLEFEKQFDAGQYSFKIEPVLFSVEEHARFLLSIDEELRIFHARQADGSKEEEQRERILLQEWEQQKSAIQSDVAQSYHEGKRLVQGIKIDASLYATIWKVKCKQGDIITSDQQVLIILEAMKTEIPVLAGEGNAGKKIQGFGIGIREGKSVRPGEVLVVLE
ncbi:urea carboxylase [Gymnopilus junonius]|uniref:Urea carboxylase n=1 Tax=Gymnopilus junonius TaxID=109634 RepID=A0A9P5NQG1_GYMJU|nr:urea carboxylase [Gymnopilus junonius]